uniref:Uncharacterized protein n=1 Tax=Romanomermis culicivorax TaxID=13658 RepID=A0A915J8H2_ROMCU
MPVFYQLTIREQAKSFTNIQQLVNPITKAPSVVNTTKAEMGTADCPILLIVITKLQEDAKVYRGEAARKNIIVQAPSKSSLHQNFDGSAQKKQDQLKQINV